MGFLSGFGSGLQKSAELEQQAQIAKKKAMVDAQLKLAEVLIASDDEELQKRGFAIYADPTQPFSMEKPHPDLPKIENVLQALGGNKASTQAVVSGESPAGMAGMLSPSESPLVQNGVGTLGDQGSGEQFDLPPGVMAPQPPVPPPPAPAPSAPPPAAPAAQPAAQTTNPPATQGGQISPQAVGAAPPAPPPAVASPPPPPPPTPPQGMGAAIDLFQQATPPRPSGISIAKEQAWYADTLKHAETLRRARALEAAGGSPEEIRATLAGREGTQIITTGMRGDTTREEGAANRESRERMAAARAEAVAGQVQARIAESTARREQDWLKHLDNLGVARARVSKMGGAAGGGASKQDLARLAKLQDKGLEIRNFADNGISGVENLRGLYQLYVTSDSPKEKVIAWERFADAAAGEAARITGAMTGMGVKGIRQTEARVKAAVKEITTTHKSWIPGYPPIPTLAPKEIEIRLDNVRHLVEDAERQARAGIEEIAANPPRPGESPLRPVPERAKAKGGTTISEGPPATPSGVSASAKTVSRAQVEKVAQKKGISVEEARKAAEAQGYTIQ